MSLQKKKKKKKKKKKIFGKRLLTSCVLPTFFKRLTILKLPVF